MPTEHERLILEGDEGDVLIFHQQLKANAAASRSTLEDLARSQHSAVRSWVATVSPTVLGTPLSLEVLRPLLDDSHPDVRDAALESIVSTDPDQARRLLPRIRKRLTSSDLWEPITALWTLARLKDVDSLPMIDDFARRSTRPWHVQDAAVVKLLLSGGSEEILHRLAGHDHDWTEPLAHAAGIIATPSAELALQRCAEASPDSRCAETCRMALRDLRSRT